jgi:hypothetical protein
MTTGTDWVDVNRRAMQDALGQVRVHLQNHVDRPSGIERAKAEEPAVAAESALGLVQQIFSLTPFETCVLVLCAGVELDAGVPLLCAAASGDPTRTEPTFSLALAALPDAHWSALAPDAPLRRWHLIEPVAVSGAATLLTRAPLRVDERVLHFLVGLDAPDTTLLGRLLRLSAPADTLPAHHEARARQVADLWSGRSPFVQLIGDGETATEIAARAAALLGCAARQLDVATMPADAADRAGLITYVNRDAMLGGGPIVVRAETIEAPDLQWLRELEGPVAVIAPTLVQRVRGVALDVAPLDADEQASVWQAALTDVVDVSALADQFNITSATIRAAAAEANITGVSAWSAARAHTRHGLDALATRIETKATWDDLVLPPAGEAQLHELQATVRHRSTVYRAWGMDRGSGLHGTGVSALFGGPSGVGKTLAAEVIAGSLGLDLYRIDLSQIVSKYIGETEKNLRLVFDAADAGGCVLLFDEADALFGKRTEVKDSHDRYANLEVSYLLQRMESYRGLAILTTNLKDNVDKAFLRRLTAIVAFPFPDAAERARIWQRMLVPPLPTEGVSTTALAALAVTGGVIRNIALGAAFRAAEDGTAVRMTHLLAAAHRECAKLERPLAAAEVGEWV